MKGRDMNTWNRDDLDWPDILFTALMWCSIIAGVAAMVALAGIGMGVW